MRKFHFIQPFVASYIITNSTAKTAQSFNSIEKSNKTPQFQSENINKSEQTLPIREVANNDVANNDYVSGAIDLDRALEEYYKSLIH